MKALLAIATAFCAAILHHADARAQVWGDPERDATKIIPLYEYAGLVYESRRNDGAGEEQAKRDARAITAVDLSSPLVSETAVHLHDARVVLANYELLKKDFPVLASKSDTEIDKWLLDKAAFIAQTQLAQGETAGVNSRISVDDDRTIRALRPYRYGRALVLPITNDASEVIGYIDVKGAGSRAPRAEGHGNGLATLGECIREYIYENLVNRILVHANREKLTVEGYTPPAAPTVGSYAVIYTGFYVTSHGAGPAGLYLRQAHTRWNDIVRDTQGNAVIPSAPPQAQSASGAGHLDVVLKARIAKILAIYDVWADETTSKGDQRFKAADVQGTQDGRLFDFGAFLVGRNPTDDDESWKSAVTNREKAAAIPQTNWGPIDRDRDPGKDKPWMWSHDLAGAVAKAVRDNSGDYRDWAKTHFRQMVTDVIAATLK
jgi:hypothetical protein